MQLHLVSQAREPVLRRLEAGTVCRLVDQDVPSIPEQASDARVVVLRRVVTHKDGTWWGTHCGSSENGHAVVGRKGADLDA